jgi:hypothetical protein
MLKEKKIAKDLSSNISLLFDEDAKVDQVTINKKEEDEQIVRFQKTGDLRALEKVYHNRIPTLWRWTKEHYIQGLTCCSKEDLFAEFTLVFVKAAHEYKQARGPFNNCLWIFLQNRVKNIKSSNYAKKRRSLDYTGPLNGMVLSLDYSYSDKDGSEVTLKDLVPSKSNVGKHSNKDVFLEETLDVLAHENHQIKEFLRKLSDGNSLTALIKEYKSKRGSVKITRAQYRQLNNRRNCHRIVTGIIEEKTKPDSSFKLVEYFVKKNVLHYKIEMNKTEEADFIIKKIRHIRRNREDYINKIRGTV